MPKLNTLSDRFRVLYAAEGRDVRECYDILKAEGFEPGLWMSFKGRYCKLPDKKELDKEHRISKSIRESLAGLQPCIVEMAMAIFLRLRLQYTEKKTLSIEEVRDFIKLAGDVLALSPQHPKYSTTQKNINLNANADLSWGPAAEMVYRAIKEVPEVRRVFEDPTINEKFLTAMQKMTVQVKKGQLLLESAPKAMRIEAADD